MVFTKAVRLPIRKSKRLTLIMPAQPLLSHSVIVRPAPIMLSPSFRTRGQPLLVAYTSLHAFALVHMAQLNSSSSFSLSTYTYMGIQSFFVATIIVISPVRPFSQCMAFKVGSRWKKAGNHRIEETDAKEHPT
jgi:hypothetical protein